MALPLYHDGERRAVWLGALIAAALFLLLATSAQPWHMFDRGPFTSDLYDAQARSLVHLRLGVPADVAGLEGFVVDGTTHLYFGLGPALLRLPVTVVTSAFDGRLTLVSQLVAIVVLGTAAGRLLARARRVIAPAHAVPRWAFALFACGVTLCTPLLFLASRSLVYHEAELWGCAAAVAALDVVLAWWTDRRRSAYIGAIALAAFALACRPSSGSAPVLCLGILALVGLVRREWATALRCAAAAVPAVVLYSAVNLARFGTLLSIPFDKQVYSQQDAARRAALAANGGTLFGLKLFPTTFVQYVSPFAQRPTRVFPFVTWSGRAHVYGGATFDTVDRAGSITAGAPVLVLLAAVGIWWVIRRDRDWGWRALAIGAAASTTTTMTVAFIAHRYLADLVPLLVVGGAPGLVVALGWWARASRRVRLAGAAVAVAVLAVATAGQAALALQARYLYLLPSPADRLAFTDVQTSIYEAMFGEVPGTVGVVHGGLPPDHEDNSIVILDDCSGLYRADGDRWWSIEHLAGAGRRLVLRGDPAEALRGQTEAPLASGSGWDLRLQRAGDGAVVVYRAPGDGVTRTSNPFDIGDGPITFDVVADPATTELRVDAGDRHMLDLVFVRAADLSAGPDWELQPGDAPLCRHLLGKLSGG